MDARTRRARAGSQPDPPRRSRRTPVPPGSRSVAARVRGTRRRSAAGRDPAAPLRPRRSLLRGGRLRLRLDVDAPAGEPRCEPGVLALFPDRQRQLVVGHDDLRRLRVWIDDDARDLGGLQRVRDQLGSVVGPGNDVDLLAAQLGDDVAHARPLRADARADRVDRGLVGPDRDLRPVPGLARDAADLHDAVLDLGHLHLEQALQQAGVRAADNDLRALDASAYLGDVGLQTLTVAVRLGRHLLGLREQRLDLAEIQQRVATLGLLDDAGDDVALAAGELLVCHLALGVAELLEDHLLGRLRADPPAE